MTREYIFFSNEKLLRKLVMINFNEGFEVNIARRDSLSYSRVLLSQLLSVSAPTYYRAGLSHLAFSNQLVLPSDEPPVVQLWTNLSENHKFNRIILNLAANRRVDRVSDLPGLDLPTHFLISYAGDSAFTIRQWNQDIIDPFNALRPRLFSLHNPLEFRPINSPLEDYLDRKIAYWHILSQSAPSLPFI